MFVHVSMHTERIDCQVLLRNQTGLHTTGGGHQLFAMFSWKPLQITMFLIFMQVLVVHGWLLTTSPTTSANQGILSRDSYLSGDGCFPLTYPVEAQCSYVREHCPETTTFLSFAHLRHYFCAVETLRPLVLLGLLLWMSLLFSTLGICASDFLCPNLSTIAYALGLDDSVTGVTLLAIGNGSPDLFATFSAMKANSGSLAIGELLGAASFIVSVVVGSMCIIKPFYVHPRPFLRDVGFFTLATGVILWILHDGILRQWEVNFLVGLYGLYVCLVVTGTWWEKMRERRRLSEAVVREEFISDNHALFLEPYRDEDEDEDEVSRTINLDVRPSRSRAISTPNPPRILYPIQRRSQSRSPPRLSSVNNTSESTTTPSLPHFSLLTALEFRDIVSSLQNQANVPGLSPFDNSISSLTSRHYRTPSVRSRFSLSRTPLTSVFENENNSSESTLSLQRTLNPIDSEGGHNGTSAADPQRYVSSGLKLAISNILYPVCRILFPQLHDFSGKSFFSLVVAILATPGVVALTLTLPVVPSLRNPTSNNFPTINVPEGQLIDGPENEPFEAQNFGQKDDQSNKWLITVQYILGPPFCAVSLLGFNSHALWYIIATIVVGLMLGILSLIFSNKTNSYSVRLGRCIMGFVIAVVWIMVIADEVVSVLKAFGLIFGLSDAIIGLTIFAIGNSLADLVANTSVAAFAPIMGFSACFGGPMLNILLGIGVSGSLIIQETGRDYNLHFSTTLLITVIGLLTILISTLIFVPRNGYFLTRSWGVFLIISYVVIMAVDIFVEIKHSQDTPS